MLLIVLFSILSTNVISGVTFEEGVVLGTNNVAWTFGNDLDLDTLAVFPDAIIFNDDNISIRPPSEVNITINKISGSGVNNNNFSITGNGVIDWDVNLPFGDRGLIVMGSKYYFPDETFLLTGGLLEFYYYSISKNMTVNIYDAETSNLITKNVTVKVFNNDNSFLTSTTTGITKFPIMIPNTYEVRLSLDNYSSTSAFYYLTTVSDYNQSIYMTSNESLEYQTIQVLDTGNQELSGAVVRMQKELIGDSGNWITVNELTTNANGKVFMPLIKDVLTYYRFSVIIDGEAQIIDNTETVYTSKTNFISGLEETVTIVVRSGSLEDLDYINELYGVVYQGYILNDTAVFEFLDATNTLSGATLRISAKYLGDSYVYELVSEETVTSNSGNLTYEMTPINNTIYKIEGILHYDELDKLVFETTKEYDVDVIADKNTGLLIAVIILLVVAFLTRFLGVLISGIATFSMLAITNIFQFTDIPITVITSLIAIVIIFFFRPRGDSQ